MYLFLDDRPERDVQPLSRKVGQDLNDPSLDIRCSRHADANALDGSRRDLIRLGQLVDQFNDPLEDSILAFGCQSGALALVENLACIRIRNGCAEVCSAKIDANITIHESIPFSRREAGCNDYLGGRLHDRSWLSSSSNKSSTSLVVSASFAPLIHSKVSDKV